MILKTYCHHVEAFALPVALAVKYDGNATASEKAQPRRTTLSHGGGQRCWQRAAFCAGAGGPTSLGFAALAPAVSGPEMRNTGKSGHS
jgi:hypothetical protein